MVAMLSGRNETEFAVRVRCCLGRRIRLGERTPGFCTMSDLERPRSLGLLLSLQSFVRQLFIECLLCVDVTAIR